MANRLKVQNGTATITDGNLTVDETLDSNISDLSRAFMIMQTSGDNGANLGSEHQATGYLYDDSGTTKIKFERDASTDDCQISYYVIETLNEDFTVQRGSCSITATNTTDTDDIASSITQSRAMIISNCRSDNSPEEGFAIGEFSDNDTVLFTRNVSTNECTIRYEVVEWSSESGVSVYTGEQDCSGNIASGTTTDITSHGITKEQTWLFCTFRHTSDGLEQTAICVDLTDDETITWQRYDQTTSYASTGRYWLIEFPSDVVVEHSGAINIGNSTDYTEAYTCSEIAYDTAWVDHYNSCNGTGTAFPRTKWIDYFSSTTEVTAQRWYNGQLAEIAFQIIDSSGWTFSDSTEADSERGIWLSGGESGSSERDIWLSGAGAGSSERGLYLSGVDTTSSQRDVWVSGGLGSSSVRSAFLHGAMSGSPTTYFWDGNNWIEIPFA